MPDHLCKGCSSPDMGNNESMNLLCLALDGKQVIKNDKKIKNSKGNYVDT